MPAAFAWLPRRRPFCRVAHNDLLQGGGKGPIVKSAAAGQLAWRLIAGGLAVASALLVSASVGLGTQGVVATSVSVLGALSVLTGAGLTHAVAWAAARGQVRSRAAVATATVVSTMVSALVGLLVAWFGSAAFPSTPVLWWWVALALPFFQFGQFGLGLQQGLGSSPRYVAVLVVPALTAFALAVMAATFGSRSENPTAWATPLVVVPPLMQAATVAWQWRSLPAGTTATPLRPLLKYTARIYPSTVAHFLSYRLDLILVSALLGATAAGIYSLALNGVDAVARIGQTVATLLFPRFASEDAAVARGVPLARRAAALAGAVSFGASLTLAVAVLLLSAERGPEIRTIGLLLALLTIGGGGVSAWGVLASYLAARNHLAAILRVNVALLAVSVIIYVGLIPLVGVYGGAIGTSVGLGLATILGYREAGKAS